MRVSFCKFGDIFQSSYSLEICFELIIVKLSDLTLFSSSSIVVFEQVIIYWVVIKPNYHYMWQNISCVNQAHHMHKILPKSDVTDTWQKKLIHF